MTTYQGTSGTDALVGADDVADTFVFESGEWSAADSVDGGASAVFPNEVDTLWLTDGVYVGSDLANVTGIESISLYGSGQLVVDTDLLDQVTSGALLFVTAAIGAQTIDASQAGTPADGFASEVIFNIFHDNDHLVGSEHGDWVTTRYGGNPTLDLQGGDDSVFLGGGGTPVVLGGAGYDRLYLDDMSHGGGGRDELFGLDGSDTADYGEVVARVDVDLNRAVDQAVIGIANVDQLDGIENLTGGSRADLLRGDGGANVLDGGIGEDVLYGRGGADTLLGGTEDDRLRGGQGSNLLDGGGGIDTVDYDWLGSGGGLYVDLLAGFSTGLGLGDGLIGIENAAGSIDADTMVARLGGSMLQGRDGADHLYGWSGQDDLRGGAGTDRLAGSGDNDLLRGGADADTFAFNLGGDGIDGVLGIQPGTYTVEDWEDGLGLIELDDLYVGSQQSTGADEEILLHATDTGDYVGGILVTGAAGLIDSSDFVLI